MAAGARHQGSPSHADSGRDTGRDFVTNEQKLWYLFWAYDFIWLAIGTYIIVLGARERRLRRAIEKLRETLGDDHD